MNKMYLIKIGEIGLKGGNRKLFEDQLKENILWRLNDKASFFGNNGRYYLTTEDFSDEKIHEILGSIFGITGFSPAARVNKNIDEIEQQILNLTAQLINNFPSSKTFKIEPRRSDKGFPFSSYEIACRLGDTVIKYYPSLTVDLRQPDFILHCEIREKALIYGNTFPGLGGLPVGCAGTGTLLLSGGIDSPVAGFVMAKRGLKLDAVYSHTPPFTSEEAKRKVEDLAKILSPFCSGIRLHTVPFTDVQLHIKRKAKAGETTLLMRACMMHIADDLARELGSKCIITGEALSQVASQTVESLTYTGSYPSLPVFRPLIGYDKEEIINIAKRIKTFDVSIQPYDDCCTVFSPSKPVVKPNFEKMRRAFDCLQIKHLLTEAAGNTEHRHFGP